MMPSSWSHRETHAEDWTFVTGVHVPQLHVAEDESGWRSIQVSLILVSLVLFLPAGFGIRGVNVKPQDQCKQQSKFHSLIYYFLSSMGPEEEMDTSPLTHNQPLFMIDKKGNSSSEKRQDEEEDGDSEQDEDPNSCIEKDEDDDNEVSVSKKVSTTEVSENRKSIETNGNQHSGSEESSEDEDEDKVEMDQVKTVNCLPVSSAAQRQTLAI